MADGSEDVREGWLERYRRRHADRRALRADRRARRRARAGASPDDAARQAESGTFQSGYFTTKTGPKP
jgi:hypothetical protein